MLGITLVNVIPSVKPSKDSLPPAGMDTTRTIFWVFMFVTALGTGGIKPCVSAFGGDQFVESSAAERCAAWG
jgi:peptide/histidine transporter 3/4